MNDWICSRVVISPLTVPTRVPRARTSKIVRNVPEPWFIIRSAAATAHNAITAPTERSIPPVRMTSVMPTAMIPFSDAKRTMLSRLREVRKTFWPLRTGATIVETMRMATSPNTLWKRNRKRPARRAWSPSDDGDDGTVDVGGGDVVSTRSVTPPPPAAATSPPP